MIGQRLKQLREEHELTQRDLANLLGVTPKAISFYELNEREPSNGFLVKISNYFHVSTDFLLGKSEENKTMDFPVISSNKTVRIAKFKKVPMLGYAAAGEPIEDLNQDVTFFDIDGKYNVDFCITVDGDSMEGADIHSGDIVFVRKQEEVPNGKIACVEIDNSKICLKRFYKTGETIMLVSENPKYSPIVLTKDNCESVRVLGLAVVKQSEIK